MVLKGTPELEAKIDAMVSSGRFPDEVAVLSAAVELLEQTELEDEWLRKELAIGLEQDLNGQTHELTRERFEMLRNRAFENAELGRPVKDAVKP
jgi:Arc/MetJ-type ribon-helix-helix transcriptional regulator